MKLIHRSLCIGIILALCLVGRPVAAGNARVTARETRDEGWTAPLPLGVTRTDWEQIRALLPADLLAQQAYLKASNTEADDIFGLSVAISGDTIVVGASSESSNATGINGDQSNNSAIHAGAAYVFSRSETTWSQQAYLKASNTVSGAFFGQSVAISGNTIVVGAPGVGTAYVFIGSGSLNGTTWSQQALLKGSNTEPNDFFGTTVSISGDTIVVGAHWEDSNATGVNGNQGNNLAPASGAAYVFTRSGTTWSQQAYLKASNTEAEDHFGISVAISGDTVVVGAYYEDSNTTGVNGGQSNNSAWNAGAAYVFSRSGAAWSQQAYLKASNTGEMDWFGHTVAISGDTIVVGATGEDSNATGVNGDQNNNTVSGAGAAYVFSRSGAAWSQQVYLKASNTGIARHFGYPVAISGGTIVVGAYYEDSNATGVNGNQNNNLAIDSGSAYVFTFNQTTWSQQAYLKASNTGLGDHFGFSIAISGDTIVVGGLDEDSNATGVNGDQANNSAIDAGAAYVFFPQPEAPTFGDVPETYWAWDFIERLYAAGITGGCSTNPLAYCPENTVTRGQMAVFLLRGIHGSAYNPPAVGGSTGFNDVPADYWAGAWIKQLAAEGITGGCGAGLYCPEGAVTRAQMAVFLLRSKYGASYTPPAVGSTTGFSDVPTTYWAAAWIKQLVAEGITSGCGTGTYCPEAPVTRAQMAVFLVRTFNLP
jgi:hypothetical protein